MADTILELGLAQNLQELDDALWETDIRIIQQISHARRYRTGIKTRWTNGIDGGGSDIEKEARKLEERKFTWLSEQL